MTASRGPSHLKYKWTMGRRKEKTGDTPSPTLSPLRIICINKFRRERIQRGGSVSQFQLCRAVSFDPPLPFSPCCVLAPPHNDFWLVTLTYAQYFEQTPAFYSYIRRNRSFATRGTINSSTGCVASRRVARRGE